MENQRQTISVEGNEISIDDTTISTKDGWEYYRTHYKHPGVNAATFRSICKRYYIWCVEQLAEGKRIMLPRRYGSIVFVNDKKKNMVKKDGSINLPIDWASTKEMWKDKPELHGKRFIYFIPNDEGKVLKLLWLQRGCMFYYKRYFKPILGSRMRKVVMRKYVDGGEFNDIASYATHIIGDPVTEDIERD